MTAPGPPTVSVLPLPAPDFRALLPELLGIYARAMGYPENGVANRQPLWADHSRRDGFGARVTHAPDGRINGFCYGYRGGPGQWWHHEVARGLGTGRAGIMADYFELTELHVDPPAQGAGSGQALLEDLLRDRTEQLVLLSTPEGTGRAWRLYRRLGFTDVLRHYRFTGDVRPFAVLGRSLPLFPGTY